MTRREGYQKEYYYKNHEKRKKYAREYYKKKYSCPRIKIKKNCKVCNKELNRKNKLGFCIKHKPTWKRTEEHKKKMSEKLSGVKKYWLRGRKRPEHSLFIKKWWEENPKQKEKARERAVLRKEDKAFMENLSNIKRGDKNAMWRGGISKSKYKLFYKSLKEKIKKRDNYTCQLCGITQEKLGCSLSVNHINFNKEDSSEENLNALCKRCNSSINYEREKWTAFFKNKLNQRGIYGNK